MAGVTESTFLGTKALLSTQVTLAEVHLVRDSRVTNFKEYIQ